MIKNVIKLAWPILKTKIIRSDIPYFCTYSVTWRCNARCEMCNIWKKKNIKEMDIREIEKVFKQIPYITGIRLTGGEPFLREDLTEIVKAINENTNVQATLITTNGILTDRIVDLAKQNKENNIRLKISLMGYMDTHDKISGHNGSFKKIMNTIENLKSIQNLYKFYLGINHTIIDMQSYADSKKIRQLCKKYKLSYLPYILYGEVPLYSDNNNIQVKDPQSEKYLNVSKQELKPILEDLIKAAFEIEDNIERFFKIYYLKGLYNRFILNKNTPNPKCVILKNHIRLLPDGNIPVCLYNSNIIGNLLQERFDNLWHSPQAVKLRQWVDNCNGCWQQCDIVPNLVYSGCIKSVNAL